MKAKQVLLNGIIQNPVFVLALGLCPTLGTSTHLESALFMGLATLFVLLCSNFIISLLKNVIPSSVRIPAYILIVATFVTVVQILMTRYFPSISTALGNYIALIVVNCIILGRAEAFASKNSVWHSVLDALSMGLGFIFAICLLGFTREIFGYNSLTLFGIDGTVSTVLGTSFTPISILVQPAGGFIVLGLLTAAFNAINAFINKKIENKAFRDRIRIKNTNDSQKAKFENEQTQKVQSQPLKESE